MLRLGVAFWNGFFGPSIGAEGDAIDFHHQAAIFSHSLGSGPYIPGYCYPYLLGVVYYLTTDSLFIGSLLSAAAWLGSAIVLERTLRRLDANDAGRRWALLIYALLPTSVLLTGVTLREAYQMLFINLAFFASLEITEHNSRLHWVTLVLAVAGMGVLHPALLVFGLGVFVGAVILSALRGIGKRLSVGRMLSLASVAAAIAVGGLSLVEKAGYRFDRGVIATIAGQQAGIYLGARSEYVDHVPHLVTAADLLLFLPAAVFDYSMQPLPWRIENPADAELFCENVVRIVLLGLAVRGLVQAHGFRRLVLGFLVLAFLVLETAWALGTINWGTAARHHLPVLGVLLLAAFAQPWRRRAAAPPTP